MLGVVGLSALKAMRVSRSRGFVVMDIWHPRASTVNCRQQIAEALKAALVDPPTNTRDENCKVCQIVSSRKYTWAVWQSAVQSWSHLSLDPCFHKTEFNKSLQIMLCWLHWKNLDWTNSVSRISSFAECQLHHCSESNIGSQGRGSSFKSALSKGIRRADEVSRSVHWCLARPLLALTLSLQRECKSLYDAHSRPRWTMMAGKQVPRTHHSSGFSVGWAPEYLILWEHGDS